MASGGDGGVQFDPLPSLYSVAVGSNLEGRPLTTHDKDGDEPGVLHVDKRVVFVGQVRNYC